MDKDFGFDTEADDFPDFFTVQFSCEDDALKAGFGKLFCALEAMAGTLGTCMEGNFGNSFFSSSCEAEVVDDESVRAHASSVISKTQCAVQFAVGNEGV